MPAPFGSALPTASKSRQRASWMRSSRRLPLSRRTRPHGFADDLELWSWVVPVGRWIDAVIGRNDEVVTACRIDAGHEGKFSKPALFAEPGVTGDAVERLSNQSTRHGDDDFMD